ncbi:MAG: polysaccharide biosynthesis tyrosine autokinase [Bacteroidetes bacterium]|nr:MAG: polysaccharide biosynthesis tyrosine autokinase [Bacteroidota bacterium]
MYGDRSNYHGSPQRHSGMPPMSPMPGTNGRAGWYRSGKQQVELVIDLLYRRRWSILMVFLLVVGGTAAYTFTRVPQYQATSYVMIDLAQTGGRGSSSASGMMPGVGGQSSNLFATARSISSEIQLLQISDELRSRVYDRFEAMRDDTTEDRAVPRGTVSFGELRGGNNIIQMTGTSARPEDAAILANLYAQEYVLLTRESNRSYITSLRKSLEERERQRRAELDEIEARMQRYVIENGAVNLDQGAMGLVMQIANLESELDKAQIELQARRKNLATLEEELKTTDERALTRMTSNADARIQQLQTRISELEAQRSAILLNNPELRENPAETPSTVDQQRLANINQSIQALRRELTELTEQYLQEVEATEGNRDGLTFLVSKRQQVNVARHKVDSLETQVGQIQKRLAEYEKEMDRVPQQTIEYARLERERLHAEQMYNYIVNQLQQARIQEEAEPGYARILRTATVPAEPVYPDKPRNLILGAFLGLLFGLGLGILRDKLDGRIFKPDQLRDKGYTDLGIIPNLKPLIKEDFQKREFLEYRGKTYATSLVTLFNPMSAPAEAYRHVRTHLKHLSPEAEARTILVTSASPSEGKSLNAANLAITMAQAGKRTLLIDADLRRPQQHRLLGAEPAPGLAEILHGKVEFSGDLLGTDIDHLYLLVAGSCAMEPDENEPSLHPEEPVFKPAELLNSPRMETLLETAAEAFDVVIIDSPPVLATADPAILAPLCDVTVIVVRAGETREAELDQAVEALMRVRARVGGILFNGFALEMAYGTRYRYKSYSKYGPYSKYGYYGYRKKTPA